MLDFASTITSIMSQLRLKQWAQDSLTHGMTMEFGNDGMILSGPGITIRVTSDVTPGCLSAILKSITVPGAVTGPEDRVRGNPYEMALSIDNACNSQGLIRSLIECIELIKLDGLLGGQLSTDDINQHPIVILFLDKLASLTTRNLADPEIIRHAVASCKNHADQWNTKYQTKKG